MKNPIKLNNKVWIFWQKLRARGKYSAEHCSLNGSRNCKNTLKLRHLIAEQNMDYFSFSRILTNFPIKGMTKNHFFIESSAPFN